MRFCYYKYAGPKDSFKSKTNFLFVECFIYYRNSTKMLKLAARCRIDPMEDSIYSGLWIGSILDKN